jgi:hypothetical protein
VSIRRRRIRPNRESICPGKLLPQQLATGSARALATANVAPTVRTRRGSPILASMEDILLFFVLAKTVRPAHSMAFIHTTLDYENDIQINNRLREKAARHLEGFRKISDA